MNTELTNQGASADGSNPIIVTFTNSKRQYTINSNGTIEYAGVKSGEDIVTSTDIYTAVCVDGENETLLFSNNKKAIEDYLEDNNTTLANGYDEIENITGDIYFDNYDEENDVESYKMPRWCGYNPDDDWNSTEYAEKITKVQFLNTIFPQNTAYWFMGLTNLTTLENISNLNTINVVSMECMFSDCSSLSTLNVSNFDTSNVTTMQGMFAGCSSLSNLNVSNFDTTNVINMGAMFSGCSGLLTLNVSNFNTTKVTSMWSLFEGCSSLTSLDVTDFNTSNVTSINSMFMGCSSLVSLDLSNFNTSNVVNMESLFTSCSNLTTIYVSDTFVVATEVPNDSVLFSGCTLLIGGNGTRYNAYYIYKAYAHIDGGASNPGYFTAK